MDGFGGGRRWCRIWPMSIRTTEKWRVSALSETCSNVRISVCELSVGLSSLLAAQQGPTNEVGHAGVGGMCSAMQLWTGDLTGRVRHGGALP